ncbi:DUF4810 domain-containing protein [Emcibacter sp.]|uniref:DUF4810 domain-containing protein n=1 Tax=Emcibacter sp. TaxID=1979954 RepID=UPI002AA74125|nr:DUF4810 domain-containing protein [Emcibacter sp.]
MKITSRGLLVILGGLFLASCGTQTTYEWNGYSNHLLAYYKNPDENRKFADQLLEDIKKAEEKDMVPPGMYAEYGYMMVELEENETALVYFSKEKEKWPESVFLMEKVISKISSNVEDADAETTPAATE